MLLRWACVATLVAAASAMDPLIRATVDRDTNSSTTSSDEPWYLLVASLRAPQGLRCEVVTALTTPEELTGGLHWRICGPIGKSDGGDIIPGDISFVNIIISLSLLNSQSRGSASAGAVTDGLRCVGWPAGFGRRLLLADLVLREIPVDGPMLCQMLLVRESAPLFFVNSPPAMDDAGRGGGLRKHVRFDALSVSSAARLESPATTMNRRVLAHIEASSASDRANITSTRTDVCVRSWRILADLSFDISARGATGLPSLAMLEMDRLYDGSVHADTGGCRDSGAGRSHRSVLRFADVVGRHTTAVARGRALEVFQSIQTAGHRRASASAAPKFRRRQQLSVIYDTVATLNASMWYADLQTLSSFNRYYNSQNENPSLDDARAWLQQKLGSALSLAPAQAASAVTLQAVSISGAVVQAWNIVGELRGTRLDTTQFIVVGAHYDSLSEAPLASAPGAEDNASGAIALLHTARALALRHAELCELSIKFVLFAAEESGLHGSKAYVAELERTNQAEHLLAAHTMDMVGYWDPTSVVPRVMIESNSIWKERFLPSYVFAAATYAHDGLEVTWSGSPFGSDHIPFLSSNLPAALVIDDDWASYAPYHRTTDTPDKVNRTIALDIIRTIIAAIGEQLLDSSSASTGSTSSSPSTAQTLGTKAASTAVDTFSSGMTAQASCAERRISSVAIVVLLRGMLLVLRG